MSKRDEKRDDRRGHVQVGEASLAWDVRILQRIDAGVDGSLIEENLRRTPTERLHRMQGMARFLAGARRDRRPADS